MDEKFARCSGKHGLYSSTFKTKKWQWESGCKRGVYRFASWNRQCRNRLFTATLFSSSQHKLLVFPTGVQSSWTGWSQGYWRVQKQPPKGPHWVVLPPRKINLSCSRRKWEAYKFREVMPALSSRSRSERPLKRERFYWGLSPVESRSISVYF